MNTVLIDFNTRVEEINDYFNFLELLINNKSQLNIIDSNGQSEVKSISIELIKTLKANCFLLLYNLVESTMRNAVEAIFDELDNKQIDFDSIKPNIKITILENMKTCFKTSSAKNISSKISNISVDIIKTTFERHKIFSGNVDARSIRDIAEKYGFSYKTDSSLTNNGENLLVVRNNRNDLAHGIKSFEEVGRDKTIEELIEIQNEVVEYLRQILNNIQNYLDNQHYLEKS